jgi:hypothetical protein
MRSQQRRRDRIELVRGADEQHLRQIDTQIEVVIEEIGVLLRVQRFEQRRRRIALVGARRSCRSRRA